MALGHQHATRARAAAAPRARAWGAALTHLTPLALYTLLGLLVTWPLAAHFRSAVVGADQAVDAYLHVWNTWHVADSLAAGRSPFFAARLYYPYGADLFWQTLGFSQGVVAAPVTLALGPVAGLNFTTISAFPIGGYAAFLLARRVTNSAPGALVAGAIYAFSSFHMDKLIAGNVVASIQWAPWYVLALYHHLERPRLLTGLLCGALLLWVSFGSWYYGMFCVLFTGLMALAWMAAGGRARALPLALWGALPVAVWGLALAPRILSLTQAGDALLWDLRELQLLRSADLLDFFLPNPLHPWWGERVRALRATMHEDAGIWVVSLGWVGTALAALGAARHWRAARRWLFLLLTTMVFAMGAVLQVAGANTGLPLPWALVQDLPGIRANHRPNHFVVLSMLMLGVLAAFGVRALTERLVRVRGHEATKARRHEGSSAFVSSRPRAFVVRSWALASMLALAVVLVDGYAGPLTVVRRATHPFYRSLPAPDGALLPLPLLLNVNRSDNLTPQIAHRHPILGGYMARPPRYDFARYTPGVRELEQGRAEPGDIVAPGWPENGRRALAAYRIRYVTLDLTAQRDPGRLGLGKAEYFARVRELLRELGVGAPLVADADLEAYAVPQAWPAAPLAFLGAGWQPLERQAGTPYRWRWMGAQAEVRLYNPTGRALPARLTLAAASHEHARPLRLALDGAPLGALPVPPGQPQGRAVSFVLPPGEHTLLLSSEASADPGRAEAISVRV
ncbi:MAG TPA: hypothetical protein VNL77_08145, partial [Roseiflexaceae bacterium]|nr:hypothetical protein [Roseiflexaceae bacterium]